MKARPLDPVAVAAARHVLTVADVRHPRDIQIEPIAARFGAMILYGDHQTARGSIVRAGKRAVIRIDGRAAGKPWSRFTEAHEFGHNQMHELVDHFQQCDADAGQKRSGTAWRVEREASHFASEFLIPEALAAPICTVSRPSVDDVERLARIFNTSFEMSAIRMVQLAAAPCAAVMAVGGRIKWATESLPFPGKIVKGRVLHAQSIAARATATRRGDESPREVPGGAWGGCGPFVEHAMRVRPDGAVLSWIIPAT